MAGELRSGLLKFSGQLLGFASSKTNSGPSSSRWTVIRLYKIKSGKYICEQVGRSLWQGERDIFSGKVCLTEKEVINFFGHGWLAKELYEECGINNSKTVE